MDRTEETKLRKIVEDNLPKQSLVVVSVLKGNSVLLSEVFCDSLKYNHTDFKNCLFEIGSLTKVLTSILSYELSKKLGIDLDAPISSYVPRCNSHNNYSISLNGLLTHYSGLPRDLKKYTFPRSIYHALVKHSFDPNDPLKTLTADEVFEEFESIKTGSSRFEYSNIGYGLIGHIFEKYLHRDYEGLLSDYIFNPLDMTSSFVDIPEEKESDYISSCYLGYEVPRMHFGALQSAGAVCSTIKDMEVLLRNILDFENSLLRDSISQTFSKNIKAESEWFCGGLFKTEDRLLYHNGETTRHSCFMGCNLSNRTGVVVLSNYPSHSKIDHIGFSLLRHFI